MKLKILDRQLKKLPEKVIFCKNCVVSNQRPRTVINKNGICSACEWSYEKNNKIDWKEREKELRDLLDKHRKNNGKYDVLVPSSGAKDSAYVAHQLKYKYKMNPLCITFAPAEWSKIGEDNLKTFIYKGFNTLVGRPDGQVNRRISKLGFLHQGQPFLPFIYGQKTFSFQVAASYNIPLIMYGENGELEYGGSTRYKYKCKEDPKDWVEFYFKGAPIKEIVDIGFETGVFSKKEFSKEYILNIYDAPDDEVIKKKKIEQHWFSYYKKWIPEENYYYTNHFTKFQSNNFGRAEGSYTKYVGLDDKLDGINFYLSYLKFGLGRASRDAQQDIRMFHITREEGVRLVNLYDHEFPKRYHSWTLDYMQVSQKEFEEVCEKYRNPNIWTKKNGKYILKYKVK